VQNELLAQYATPLLEKEHSGCSALLRDDKVGLKTLNIHCIPLLLQVEDLSRMYRLFSKITRGLEPISNMFKTVIISLAGCLFSFLAHSFYSFEP